MKRGDRLPLIATIYVKGTSTLWNIAGGLFRFSVKKNFEDQDPGILSITSATGRIIADPATSTLSWEILPADMASAFQGPINTMQQVVWDLQYTDAANHAINHTIDSGILRIEPDVSITYP